MKVSEGCIVCGKEIVYFDTTKDFTCHFCGNNFNANVSCRDGHYVCDSCHRLSALDFIESFCLSTTLTDPLEMAIRIMEHPSVHMHGPEHHFIPAAVLITAFYKAKDEIHFIEKALRKAKQRSEVIPGGMCGTHGGCGAALSAGLFMSVVTGATPLAKEEWKLSNKMTSLALSRIAESGGPRCCKRTNYQSILEAVDFVEQEFAVKIPVKSIPVCKFYSYNKECLFKNCEFFKPEISVQFISMKNIQDEKSCCSGNDEFKTFFNYINNKNN